LDADERVSPALAAAINKAIEEGKADGYEIPRLSLFCGRWMRHSGWFPDYVLRLFRRDKGRFSHHLVHTRVICDGKVERLTEPLTHFAIRRIHDSIAKMDSYSTSGAKEMLAAGRKVKFSSGIAHGAWAFFRCYFLMLGILDGREGFLLAVANAEGTYYRYMKAWLELRRG
jgi:hypothetical protein